MGTSSGRRRWDLYAERSETLSRPRSKSGERLNRWRENSALPQLLGPRAGVYR